MKKVFGEDPEKHLKRNPKETDVGGTIHKGYKNCVSSSGVVHAVEHSGDDGVSTLCNHRNYHEYGLDSFYHKWEKTDKSITCKRCLSLMHPDKDKLLGDIIENTEQWIAFFSKCNYYGDIVDGESTCYLNSTPNVHEWGKWNPCKPSICPRIETFLNTAKGLTKKKG